jgi:hypothetical protein
MTAALEGGEWSAARPGLTLPPGKTRYPFYRRLGVPQDRSERAGNLVLTGIRLRTFQLVAQSLYRLSYRAHGRNGHDGKEDHGEGEDHKRESQMTERRNKETGALHGKYILFFPFTTRTLPSWANR